MNSEITFNDAYNAVVHGGKIAKRKFWRDEHIRCIRANDYNIAPLDDMIKGKIYLTHVRLEKNDNNRHPYFLNQDDLLARDWIIIGDEDPNIKTISVTFN